MDTSKEEGGTPGSAPSSGTKEMGSTEELPQSVTDNDVSKELAEEKGVDGTEGTSGFSNAIVGRGLGLLSSAATVASTAAAAAGNVRAKDLEGSLGMLSSAALAAGSAAAVAGSAAAAAGSAATRGAVTNFGGTLSNLLAEDEPGKEDSTGSADGGSGRSGKTNESGNGGPSDASVLLIDNEPAASGSNSAPQVASARSSVGEGWSFEEPPTSGPSLSASLQLEDPSSTLGRRSPAPSLGAASVSTSGGGDGASVPPAGPAGLEPSVPHATAPVAHMGLGSLGAAVSKASADIAQATSPAPSSGPASSESNGGVGTGTSEEYTRCEVGAGQHDRALTLHSASEESLRVTSLQRLLSDEQAAKEELRHQMEIETAKLREEANAQRQRAAAAEERCAAEAAEAAEAQREAVAGAAEALAVSRQQAEAEARASEERIRKMQFDHEAALGAEREARQRAENAAKLATTSTENAASNSQSDSTTNDERICQLEATVASLEATKTQLQNALENKEITRIDLANRVAELETEAAGHLVKVEAGRAEQEVQLSGATQQLQRLQGRIEELEGEHALKDDKIAALYEQVDRSQQQIKDHASASEESMQDVMARLAEAKASEKKLIAQVGELKRECQVATKDARAQATKEKDAVMDQVREEMEKELEGMLKQKDAQIKSLQAELTAKDKTIKEQAREVEKHKNDSERLQSEVDQLRHEGEGQLGDHQKKLDNLVSDHQKRVDELDKSRELEERQKHELALNLRSVEERARSEIAQLEAQKAQLELQHRTLQEQLEAQQQQCADLSISLGEATTRLSQLEVSEGGLSGPEGNSEQMRRTLENEVQDLRERLRIAEEKLLDSQSMRDMFAKETDMYRAELKVAHDARGHLEEELTRLQERTRELQATQGPGDSASARQAVVQSMQKDFEDRMERYRDEVQYLRQKCDEKDKRCEQLLAERSSLAAELRSATSASAADIPRDLEAGVNIGGKAGASKALASSTRGNIRSLPLSAPWWLRSSDEPLRLVVRTLALYPQARIGFFAYVLLLHAWVLFVLQNAVLQRGIDSNPGANQAPG